MRLIQEHILSYQGIQDQNSGVNSGSFHHIPLFQQQQQNCLVNEIQAEEEERRTYLFIFLVTASSVYKQVDYIQT